MILVPGTDFPDRSRFHQLIPQIALVDLLASDIFDANTSMIDDADGRQDDEHPSEHTRRAQTRIAGAFGFLDAFGPFA